MVNIIWNIERISPYCCVAADIGELFKRDLISLLTWGKGRIVPDDIPCCGRFGWCGDKRRAKKDAINIKRWPSSHIPKPLYHLILITPLYERFPIHHIDKRPQITHWMKYRAELVELLLLAYFHLILAYLHLFPICLDSWNGEDCYSHCSDGAYP